MAFNESSNEIFSSNNDSSFHNLDLQDAVWEIWWLGQFDRGRGKKNTLDCPAVIWLLKGMVCRNEALTFWSIYLVDVL